MHDSMHMLYLYSASHRASILDMKGRALTRRAGLQRGRGASSTALCLVPYSTRLSPQARARPSPCLPASPGSDRSATYSPSIRRQRMESRLELSPGGVRFIGRKMLIARTRAGDLASGPPRRPGGPAPGRRPQSSGLWGTHHCPPRIADDTHARLRSKSLSYRNYISFSNEIEAQLSAGCRVAWASASCHWPVAVRWATV